MNWLPWIVSTVLPTTGPAPMPAAVSAAVAVPTRVVHEAPESVTEQEPTPEAPAPAPAAAPAPAPAPGPAAESTPVPVPATTYTLQHERSLLYVVVRPDPSAAASALGHEHAVAATGWEGVVTWHPDDASLCEVEFSVPVDGLQVDPAETQRLLGIGVDTTDSMRRKIGDNFRGKNQLNAKAYPTIHFLGTECSGTEGLVLVDGELTLRGQTRPVTVSMDVDLEHGFEANGGFTTTHTAFGFEPFRALAGALRNHDDLEFGIRVVGG